MIKTQKAAFSLWFYTSEGARGVSKALEAGAGFEMPARNTQMWL